MAVKIWEYSFSMRILVVDDDHVVLLAIARPLRKAGYEVVEASRVEQVVKAAESGKFDVAILDIFMPGMGGIAAIQRIHAGSPKCRIIAITAGYADMSAEDTIRAAVKIGATTGFTKPIDSNALLTTVRKWGAPKNAE